MRASAPMQLSAVRDIWVRAALAAALLLPAFYLGAALGTRAGVFDWRTGVLVLSLQVGPALSLAALLAGVMGLALSGLAAPRRGWRLALAAVLVSAMAVALEAGPVAACRRMPRLYDISTDVLDPPNFSPSVAAERALTPHSNSLDLDRERVGGDVRAPEPAISAQEIALPDIRPIVVTAAPSRALSAAQEAAQKLGWDIDRVDRSAGVIEARSENFWYGITCDIVIRIRARGAGAVIDMRASSRTAAFDLGANAARVRAFQREISRALAHG